MLKAKAQHATNKVANFADENIACIPESMILVYSV